MNSTITAGNISTRTSPITSSASSGSYELVPLAGHVADEFRAVDAAVYTADSFPGYPCRQCLCDAEIGEELILVSHDPFHVDSPYRSASPIFVHREPCGPPTDAALPEQLTRRTLSVRSFDIDGLMIDAALIDGAELDGTIERLIADSASDFLHVHNEPRGCWAVEVRPARSAQSDQRRQL